MNVSHRRSAVTFAAYLSPVEASPLPRPPARYAPGVAFFHLGYVMPWRDRVTMRVISTRRRSKCAIRRWQRTCLFFFFTFFNFFFHRHRFLLCLLLLLDCRCSFWMPLGHKRFINGLYVFFGSIGMQKNKKNETTNHNILLEHLLYKHLNLFINLKKYISTFMLNV